MVSCKAQNPVTDGSIFSRYWITFSVFQDFCTLKFFSLRELRNTQKGTSDNRVKSCHLNLVNDCPI